MDSVLVVGVIAVAARGRADDILKSELNDALKGLGGDFRTKAGVGDRVEDGARHQTGAAHNTCARFRSECVEE